ncbi:MULTISPECIES: glutathione peroxidase [Priestia]|jgi:glutathione peroxidase|uniref:Glutathione peroxidase n=2 Tax=Priestia TaxID=2800373 RepID=A0A269VVL7_PRIMG|nr:MULTISPECIES: glutathione peroxidase [Priestia]AVX08035.1 glutathione peroxidase [Bacillus sp. Y-01]KQU25701.1 glutathione peroxidase [Bacillus sp. Leaf75]KRF55491.1 glutathione peroxidase [Bacillus sp. Soil531]MBZ5480751.1 glutathione peroxidase [Bacillus sp. T_4]MCF6795850.1 glutathione peroxidase [Bacillus sp. ET1]MDP9574823.1 glutathione peroxidase [Bacillus sp. 1751]MEB2276335.1 glutathione peroxidase [Bacillus sp. ILBB4]RCX25847.1 glutathione peroxidase [Bacillus sp. AG236]RFB3004
MSVYEYSAKTIKDEDVSLSNYQGDVLLIVNTASKCGFTPQYKDLQALYEEEKENGLTVLGFPCNQFGGQEPGSSNDIEQFCELNYGVSFPMFAKVDVKGEHAHPLFTYLTEQAPGLLGSKGIKWNFTKFLVNRQGEVVKRYAPQTAPKDIQKDIKELL